MRPASTLLSRDMYCSWMSSRSGCQAALEAVHQEVTVILQVVVERLVVEDIHGETGSVPSCRGR